MTRTASGMVIAPVRQLVLAVRGAVLGSIDGYHQMTFRVVDVPLCGVLNEVVGAMDHTLGLPREGIHVHGLSAVEEAPSSAVVAGVGNDHSWCG